MKRKIRGAAAILISFLLGVLLGGSGMWFYRPATKEAKNTTQEDTQVTEESEKSEKNSLTSYETEPSFILTKDCKVELPKDMAVYETTPVTYKDYNALINEFYLSGMDEKFTKSKDTRKDSIHSADPIEIWQTKWIEDGHRVTVERSSDYFHYSLESKLAGSLLSSSGLIDGIDGTQEKMDDYYTEKGTNVMKNTFHLSDHVEGGVGFDEEHKEEYGVRTFFRKEKGLPILGAYYYKNKKEKRIDGETIAIRINSRGVIGMTLAHARELTKKKKSISSSELISIEKAADAVLDYLKEDKDMMRRLSTTQAYAVWYPVEKKGEILYYPAWYMKTQGSCFYPSSIQDGNVSQQVNTSFCVDMCTGQVHELFDTEY